MANHNKRVFRCGSTQTADGRPCQHLVHPGQLTCPAGHVVGSHRASVAFANPFAPADPAQEQSWTQARQTKEPATQRAIALHGEPEQKLALCRNAALHPSVLREMAADLAATFQQDADPPSERTQESVLLSALATHPNCPDDVALSLTRVPDAHVTLSACLRLSMSHNPRAKHSAQATLAMLQSLEHVPADTPEDHTDYTHARQQDLQQRREMAQHIAGFQQTSALRHQVSACLPDLQAVSIHS
jgi:hypothetical protein